MGGEGNACIIDGGVFVRGSFPDVVHAVGVGVSVGCVVDPLAIGCYEGLACDLEGWVGQLGHHLLPQAVSVGSME